MATFLATILSPGYDIIKRFKVEADDEFDAIDLAQKKFESKFKDDPDAQVSVVECPGDNQKI